MPEEFQITDSEKEREEQEENQKKKQQKALLKAYICSWCVCPLPVYIYCPCAGPMKCRKYLRAVLVCAFASVSMVVAFFTYVVYNKSVAQYSNYVGFFGFLGCALATRAMWNNLFNLSKVQNDLTEHVNVIRLTHEEVLETLRKNAKYIRTIKQGVNEIAQHGADVRRTRRRLAVRAYQGEDEVDKVEELLDDSAMKAFAQQRHFFHDVSKEHVGYVVEIGDDVNTMQTESQGAALETRRMNVTIQDLQATAATICVSIDELEKTKKTTMGTEERDRQHMENLKRTLQELVKVIEEMTVVKEIGLLRTVFIFAIRRAGKKEGLTEADFDNLLISIPSAIRRAINNSPQLRFQNYREKVGKRLGRTKYGTMKQKQVYKFLDDCEREAHLARSRRLAG